MDIGKIYNSQAHLVLSLCTFLCYVEWMILAIKQVDTAVITSESVEQKTLDQAIFLVELLKSDYIRVLRGNTKMQNYKEEGLTCATTTNVPARRHNYNKDYDDEENASALRRFYDEAFGPQPGSANIRETSVNTQPTTTTTTTTITSPKSTYIKSVFTKSTATKSTAAKSTATKYTSTKSTSTESTFDQSSATSGSTTTTTNRHNNRLMESESYLPIVTNPVITTSYTTRETTSITTTSTNMPETVTNPPSSTSHALQKKNMSFSKTATGTTTTSYIWTSPKIKHAVPHVSRVSQLKMSNENIVTQIRFYGQKLLHKSTQKQGTVEIELSQAAAELDNEFYIDFSNVKALKYKTQKLPVTWRGTTRIHLAGSTRYPIPLPENNAFCYTNPNSALCRTFI